MDADHSYTAFLGPTRIASGPLREVALKAKAALDADETRQILVFDDANAQPVELDLRGAPADVVERLAANARATSETAKEAPRRRGRPKLGVVAREVTLLPRHWDWLQEQPGGASVALRKLVEDARRSRGASDLIRRAQERAYRFMVAMAGNEPGFEEAARALFAKDKRRFEREVEAWPSDLGDYARALARHAFDDHIMT